MGFFRVLILGDGNFSFTLAVAQLLFPEVETPTSHLPRAQDIPNTIGEEQRAVFDYFGLPWTQQNNDDLPTHSSDIEILATSFDSEEEVLEKYPESHKILSQLKKYEQHGIKLRHNVNAWELAELKITLGGTSFDCICWNHPHLGTEDARLHRFLMAHFFHSTKAILHSEHPFASVVVTLLQGQEARWSLEDTAKEAAGYQPVPRTFFNETAFPGYICKRNKNSQSFKNSTTRRDVALNHFKEMHSHLYRFVPQQSSFLFSSATIQPSPDRPDLLVPTDNIIRCHPCNRVFLDRTGFIMHIKAKHWSKATPEATTPSDDFQHHIDHRIANLSSTHQTTSHACSDCPKTFKSLDDLRQHSINKHTELAPGELPSIGNAGRGGSDGGWRVDPAVFLRDSAKPFVKDEKNDDHYTYVPCPICAQAIPSTASGYALHLETLKPLLGQKMQCPLCTSAQQHALREGPLGYPRRALYLKAKQGSRSYNEERALVQHYRFCRAKQSTSHI